MNFKKRKDGKSSSFPKAKNKKNNKNNNKNNKNNYNNKNNNNNNDNYSRKRPMAKYENSMHDCQWFNLKLILTNNRERGNLAVNESLSFNFDLSLFNPAL